MMSWFYWVPACGIDRDDHRRVRGLDVREAAEAAAEDFHANCDGWENTWPVTFHLARIEDNRDEGPEIIVEVEREYEPIFHAARKWRYAKSVNGRGDVEPLPDATQRNGRRDP